MSGIFGFVQGEADRSNTIDINRMRLWNSAYGSDDEEMFIGECFGLGCCYEKLSAEAKMGTPVLKANHKYAVVDALLFNREELIERCQEKATLSDEELLICYIDKFGLNALKDVNGDFCGAIYDDREKSLTLFRDHMGIRPLFYFINEVMVAFSTDIRGLVALPQIDASVDEDWLYKTITGHISTGKDNTEFKYIFCVPPAGYIKFSLENNKIVTQRNEYWQLGSKKIRFSSETAYRNQLRELITDAVKRRLDVVSDPVGAELSGGLDSGVIDILINRMGREGIYVSWSPDPKDVPLVKNDERLVILDICEQENIVCNYGKTRISLGPESAIAGKMREMGIEVNHDEQTALRYILPPYSNTHTICETAQFVSRNGARVVFTGHGGDEGVSHRCNPYEMFFHREYYHFLRYMWSTTHGKKRRIRNTLKKCYRILSEERKQLKQPFQMHFASPELLKADFSNKFIQKKMPPIYFAYDPKKYIKEGGSRNRLDVMAMLGAYSGVRYLAPFLDYRVIDFAVSIPRHMYLKGRSNRYIFREAFKEIMPESLYRLQIKEDNSFNSVEEDSDWFEEFSKYKKEALDKLDRVYWEPYLDFDVIDKWFEKGRPSEEERKHEQDILYCLFLCAMLGNVVKRTREDTKK